MLALCGAALFCTTPPPPAPAQDFEVSGGVGFLGADHYAGSTSLADAYNALSRHGDRVYVAGSQGGATGEAWSLAAYDEASGALLWSATWAVDSSEFEHEAFALAVAPGGASLYATGSVRVGGERELAVAAFDASDGSLLWSHVRVGAPEAIDIGTHLSVSADGARLWVGGRVEAPESSLRDYYVASFLTHDGSLQWEVERDFAQSTDELYDLALDPDEDRVLVTGRSFSQDQNYDALTLALDSLTGGELWATATGAAGALDSGEALCVDAARVYVTGTGAQVAGTHALDLQTGAVLWASQPDVRGVDVVHDPKADALYVFETLAPLVFFDGDVRVSRLDPSDGSVQWASDWNTPAPSTSSDHAVALRLADGGARVLALTSTTLNGAPSGPTTVSQVLSFDASNGAASWQFLYDHPGGGLDVPADLQLASDGSAALVAGRASVTAEGFDALLFRVDGAGGLDWLQAVQNQGPGDDRSASLALAPDGSLALLVGELRGASRIRGRLVAVDPADGELAWSYDDDAASGKVGAFHQAVFSADSGVAYAVGGEGKDAVLVALDASDGSELWRTVHAGSLGHEDELTALALAPDGATLFATGAANERNTTPVNPPDVLVLAVDATTGSLLWSRELDHSDQDERGVGLVASPDGARLYLSAVADVDFFQCDYWTHGLDAASGASLWEALFDYDIPLAFREDRPVGLALAPDGARLYVTGSTYENAFAFEGYDWATVAYDTADGTLLWESAWDAGPDDRAVDLVPSADGARLYVGGHTAEGFFLTVIAYDSASGQQDWRSEIVSGLGSRAVDLELAPDGRSLLLLGREGEDEALVALGLHHESGELAWRADYDGVLPEGDRGAALRIDPTLGQALVGGTLTPQPSDDDMLLLRWSLPTLLAPQRTLSLSAGGEQPLELLAGPGQAGALHLLLGSLSGSEPGLPLGAGLVLPLQLDAYTMLLLDEPLAGPVPGALGALDAAGSAALALVLPPGTNPNLAGLDAHHAYLTLLGGQLSLVSNAVVAHLAP